MGNTILKDEELCNALRVISGNDTDRKACNGPVTVREIASSLGTNLHEALTIAERLQKKGLVTTACLVQKIACRKFRITEKGEHCLSGISS